MITAQDRAARMMRDNTATTVYDDGLTMLEQSAEFAAKLIDGAYTGETNIETAAGRSTHTAETFTLSGGGPASDLTVILNDGGEPIEAFHTYYDGGKTATVYLDRANANEVFAALTGLQPTD
jgi:hypothetical protein